MQVAWIRKSALNQRHFHLLTEALFSILQAGKECRKLTQGNADIASVPAQAANDFITSKLSGNTWIGGEKTVSTKFYYIQICVRIILNQFLAQNKM